MALFLLSAFPDIFTGKVLAKATTLQPVIATQHGANMKTLITALALISLPLSSMAVTIVTMDTNQGQIELALDEVKAPKTVANFVQYAKSGHYNGTIFHRVINGFMVQGGGFTPDMKQKPTRAPIGNEANNGLKNTVGTISMARTSDPNSATAQFFINVAKNDFLDYKNSTPQGWGYAVFGKVTRGMNIVQRIAKTPTTTKNGMADVPVTAIVINKVTIKQKP